MVLPTIGRTFSELLSADWGYLFSWPQGRPIFWILTDTWIWLGYKLGGISGLYFGAFLLQWICSFFVLKLLLRLLPFVPAFLGAIFFAVFPPDTSKQIIMHQVVFPWMTICLLFFFLLFKKRNLILAFSVLAREKGLKLSILRIFQVYGPGEHESRFWPNLKKKAENGEDFQMSPGKQIRDFILVERVADRFVSKLATDVPAGKPRVRHVGTGNPKSLKEFAAAEWAESKAKGRLLIGALPYRNGEIMRLVPSLS